jgi:membrane associated rhomboid family serine protease
LIPIVDDRNRIPVFPIVVYAIVVTNILVFVQEANAPQPDAFINSFALIPYDVSHGVQLPAPSPPVWLTLVTSQFLHGGFLHIFFNMLFLIVFGPQLEYLCGHFRFAAFYLFCGIAGGIAQIVVSPGSHVPSIGASGAIAGVLGAYIVRYPTNDIRTIVPIGCFPLLLRLPAALVIGIWAVVQFVHGIGSITTNVSSEEGGGIAYFAHIGGFLAGVFTIDFFAIRRMPAGRRYRMYY